MDENMDAIYEELLRLKSEGVDRIFINSDTTELLGNLSRAKSSSESEHIELGDNNEPIKSHSNPSIPKTAKEKADLVVEETNTLSLKPKSISLPSSDKKSQMDWLRKQIESCATCTAEVRSDEKIVFGSGDVNADIFFCSDAPNEEEARSGTPLTGSLGDLMFKIIKAMGLKNDSIYTTHVVKWRPKHYKTSANSAPNLEQIGFCAPYLQAQIAVVMPKVIIALGKISIAVLTNRDPTKIVMKDLRGKWENVENIPTIFTYHPSYLLYNNTLRAKRQFWEDMLEVMQKLNIPISQKQKEYFLCK